LIDNSLEPILEKIDRLLESNIDKDGPGYIATLTYKGSTIFSKGYGYANLEYRVPITEETSFYIASISKQFTAMCILLLEEKGFINLGKSIRKYIPELPEYANDITVRHLIHHTSGLREYYDLVLLRGQGKQPIFDSLTTKDMINLVLKQSNLSSPVGKEFSYCNSGYFLLVELIQRISGQSFYQFVNENIFTPLGMDSAFFIEDSGKIIPNYATAYDKVNDEYKIYTTRSSLAGPTGIVCAVADLIKWDRCFKARSLGIGKADLISRLLEPGKLKDGSDTTYACGISVDNYRDLTTAYHGGGLFGYTSFYIRFLSEDFTIILFSNLRKLKTDEISYRIADIFLTEYLGHPEPTKEEQDKDKESEMSPVEPVTTNVQSYTGLYRSRTTKTTLMVKPEGKGIAMTIRGFCGDYGECHLFHPVSENEFVLVERRSGPVLPPGKIAFLKGEKGLEVNIYYNNELTSTYDHYRSRWDDFEVQQDLNGRYYCEDLDTYYNVIHKDSTLTLSSSRGNDILFFQNMDNEFRAESNIIEIQRDESCQVFGLNVFLGPTQEIGIAFKKL